jgi:hypothetical protein
MWLIMSYEHMYAFKMKHSCLLLLADGHNLNINCRIENVLGEILRTNPMSPGRHYRMTSRVLTTTLVGFKFSSRVTSVMLEMTPSMT